MKEGGKWKKNTNYGYLEKINKGKYMKKVIKKASILILVISLIFVSGNIINTRAISKELLYVNFNDNVEDKSGNGNNGIINGDVEYVEGVSGKAIHIVNNNGSTSVKAEQYVDFGDKIKFGTDDFALSFWYRSDNGVANGGAMISNKNFDSGANQGFNIGDFNTGIRVNFTAQESSRKDVYNFAPIDGVWHYVVVNFDRDGYIETFVDNKSAGKTDISKDADKSIDAANFVIGADGYFKNGLDNAYLDELKVYSRLMSLDEIEAEFYPSYLQYIVSDAEKFYLEAQKMKNMIKKN